MEKIDLDAARRTVCVWLDEHKDSSLAHGRAQASLPDYPEEMAVVLRDMMAAELRRRTQPGVVSTAVRVLR
jgi:hypothetical protein